MATSSQRYLSTRGGSKGLSFEQAVLKGLAADGGLFIPEEIPKLPQDWESKWKDLSYEDLAFEVFSLYISPSEIPADDLRGIIKKSYSTFRVKEVTPLVDLDASQNLHLLELFHGPTFAFKDVALQFLGNLFEYFLVRQNASKPESGGERHHLTVIGATSGDTGSAAIYGLRGKKDVSVCIFFPFGRVSPIQEAQMTTVLDENVHNIALSGTFDDCQDMLKALFADEELNRTNRLGAVNSINWARILAQTVYYFYAYLALTKLPAWKAGESKLRFVVPSGNFGDILAGFFAKEMGLPVAKLVVATNENDILDRFFKTGSYAKSGSISSKEPSDATAGLASDGAKAGESGVIETLSPAMDILVSSNFERLLYLLLLESPSAVDESAKREEAASTVSTWLGELKSKGAFSVPDWLLTKACESFASERVSDPQTLATIRTLFAPRVEGVKSHVLDPHTAIGVAAGLRCLIKGPEAGDGATHTVCLATAHPAKFAGAVKMALEAVEGFNFEKDVLPEEFRGLEEKERRVKRVGVDGDEVTTASVRDTIRALVAGEKR